MGDSHALSILNSEAVELEEDDEYWPLSGKPYFDIVLSKTHINHGRHMNLPNKLLPDLPPGTYTILALLSYRRKSWNIFYHIGSNRHAFHSGWKTFVIDNDLKVGDVCVFELSECSASELKFRVQILRVISLQNRWEWTMKDTTTANQVQEIQQLLFKK